MCPKREFIGLFPRPKSSRRKSLLVPPDSSLTTACPRNFEFCEDHEISENMYIVYVNEGCDQGGGYSTRNLLPQPAPARQLSLCSGVLAHSSLATLDVSNSKSGAKRKRQQRRSTSACTPRRSAALCRRSMKDLGVVRQSCPQPFANTK